MANRSRETANLVSSTGISTFRTEVDIVNGPVQIGSATSTGTADQKLQVTGGAYVSGSVGIGTTNPLSLLTVSSNQQNFEFTPGSSAYNGGVLEYINRTTSTTRPDFNYFLGGGSNGAHKFYINASEKFRISSSGNVGVGTTTPEEIVHLGGASNKQIRIDSAYTTPGFFGASNDAVNISVNRRTSDGAIINSTRCAAFITLDGDVSGSKILFNTINTVNTEPGEALRIDQNKRILTGTTSSFCNDKVTIQTGGNSGSPGVLGIRNANATSGLSNNGVLGTLNFGARANEGDNYALISALVDGTPSSGTSYPGRLIFSTTGAGSTTPTERLIINSLGYVGFSTNIGAKSQVSIAHTTNALTTLVVNAGNNTSKGEYPLLATMDAKSVSESNNGHYLYDNSAAGDLQLYRKQYPDTELRPVLAIDRSQTQVAIGTDGFYPGSLEVPIYVRGNDSTGNSYGAFFGSNDTSNYGLNGGIAVGANPTTGDGFISNLGPNNGIAFYTEATGGIARVAARLSPIGIHTVGNQPAFSAVRSSTSQTGMDFRSVSTQVAIFNEVSQNIGGHYDGTTGLFTAPVSGRYAFSVGGYISVAVEEAWWIINGGRSITPLVFPSGGTFVPKAVDVIYLSAGDTIGIHFYDSGGSTSGIMYQNFYHTYFKGYLVC